MPHRRTRNHSTQPSRRFPERWRAGAQRLLLGILIGFYVSGLPGADLPPGFSEFVVASGLSRPTAMEFAPDGRLFVCQQGGELRVIKNLHLLAVPFLTVT